MGRAAKVHQRTSDCDVLIIGKVNKRFKRAGLDLICITVSDSRSDAWLNSEIASHISTYGVWLEGSGEWRNRACIGEWAIRRKERRLASLVRSVKGCWTELHPLFQHKYRNTIRRECQRLDLLRNRIPIPPTPLLDLEWQSRRIGPPELLLIVRSLPSLAACTTFVVNEIAERELIRG